MPEKEVIEIYKSLLANERPRKREAGTNYKYTSNSAGRFEKASDLNRISIVAYLIFVINGIMFFTFIIKFIFLNFTSIRKANKLNISA
ncbi:MAG: hypothetical protein JST15_01545 [Bacteroidetes bacterium]|nr:hypothetical protein [Bacteroidota bacterium]